MRSRRPAKWDRACLVVLVLLSAALAAQAYVQYLDVARFRWDGIVHDRNGHYAYGLSLATALRDVDVFGFLGQLEKGKVWPPLHGVLVAIVTSIGGFDHRLAVLPSLAAFLLAMVCGFLLARRLVPGRLAGVAAGVVALIFIACSPAHRAFATDVMLESLGAGLTLLVHYLFVLAVQRPEAHNTWRAVAIALTLLFFAKYNYWALVVLALVTTWIVPNRARALLALRAALRQARTRWLVDQLRHPVMAIAVILAAIAAAIFVRGPTSIEWLGARVSVYPPNNILTVAYVLALVRVVATYRRSAVRPIARLAPAAQALARWHVAPVLASFVLPDRLGVFFWHLTSSHGAEAPWSPAAAMRLYGSALATDYHASLFSVATVVGLFTLALFRRRHLREGALSVLVLPILAIVLCSVHPKVESRMLHSWMAVSWVAAGAGFGSLAAGRARASHAGARLRRAAAVVSVLVLMVGQGPGALGAGHSASAGHRGGHASLLDVTDTYLPDLSGSRSPAILSTIPCRPLLAWTFLERYPHRRDLELPRWDAVTTREDLRHAFDTWVATTQSDTVVVLDIPRDSYFGVRLPGPGAAVHRAVIDLMQAQDEFLEMRRWFFDRYGLTVTLWRRRPPER